MADYLPTYLWLLDSPQPFHSNSDYFTMISIVLPVWDLASQPVRAAQRDCESQREPLVHTSHKQKAILLPLPDFYYLNMSWPVLVTSAKTQLLNLPSISISVALLCHDPDGHSLAVTEQFSYTQNVLAVKHTEKPIQLRYYFVNFIHR